MSLRSLRPLTEINAGSTWPAIRMLICHGDCLVCRVTPVITGDTEPGIAFTRKHKQVSDGGAMVLATDRDGTFMAGSD